MSGPGGRGDADTDAVTEGVDELDAVKDRVLVKEVEGVRDGEDVMLADSEMVGVTLADSDMVGVMLGVMDMVGVRDGDTVVLADAEADVVGDADGEGRTFTVTWASIMLSPVKSLS